MPRSRISIRRLLILLAVMSVGLWSSFATAHEINISSSTLTIEDGDLTADYTFTLHDLALSFPLDANQDGMLTPEEMNAALPGVLDFLQSHLTVALDEQQVTWDTSSWELKRTDGKRVPPDMSFSNDADLVHVQAVFHFNKTLDGTPQRVTLAANLFEKFSPKLRHSTEFTFDNVSQQALIDSDSPTATFATGYRTPLVRQVGRFTLMGIEHIFTGYDHIAFIICLVIVGGKFTSLLKTVTAFTVAHSLTLILAALHIYSPVSRWVESGIALTIAYVAIENIVLKTPRHRWVLAFGFGLIHGFGLAGALAETGLPTRGLVPSLLAFNIGVEIAQVAIIALLYPHVIWLSRTRYYRLIVVGVSSLILLLALAWFIDRAFNLNFMPF